jgi:hypothetical protein
MAKLKCLLEVIMARTPIGKKPMVPKHLTIVVMIVMIKICYCGWNPPYVNKPNDQHLITPKSTLETQF